MLSAKTRRKTVKINVWFKQQRNFSSEANDETSKSNIFKGTSNMYKEQYRRSREEKRKQKDDEDDVDDDSKEDSGPFKRKRGEEKSTLGGWFDLKDMLGIPNLNLVKLQERLQFFKRFGDGVFWLAFASVRAARKFFIFAVNMVVLFSALVVLFVWLSPTSGFSIYKETFALICEDPDVKHVLGNNLQANLPGGGVSWYRKSVPTYTYIRKDGKKIIRARFPVQGNKGLGMVWVEMFANGFHTEFYRVLVEVPQYGMKLRVVENGVHLPPKYALDTQVKKYS